MHLQQINGHGATIGCALSEAQEVEDFHPCGGAGGVSRVMVRGEVEEGAAFIDGKLRVVFKVGDYNVRVLADKFR